jgi:DNA-binding response OmpR family regulator
LEKENCDIVILDVMMPEMDGWKICEKIGDFSKVPIIMLTAGTAKQDIVRGLENWSRRFFIKTFSRTGVASKKESIGSLTALILKSVPINSFIYVEIVQ